MCEAICEMGRSCSCNCEVDCSRLGEREIVFFQNMYNKIDKNGSIVIETSELIEELQETHIVPEDVAREIEKICDPDCDGKVNFTEFVNFVTKYTSLFNSYFGRYTSLFRVDDHRVVLERQKSLTGSYYENSKCTSFTCGILILTITQIFLYYSSLKGVLMFRHDKRNEVWRYISYIFTHNSDVHIWVNLTVQILVGIPLEMVHSWRVMVIYAAGTLGGSLFHSVCDPLQNLAGASPGIYAILTAHISKIILNYREISHALSQLILFAIFTILETVYKYYAYENHSSTSYVSHVGGAICGFLAGVLILRNLNEKYYEIIIWQICAVLYTTLMLILIALEIMIYKRHGK